MGMNEKGLSLIFAIIFLLIFSVLVSILSSLVSSDVDMAFHDFRSGQAQYVADGGIEYALGTGTFPNYSYPPFSTRGPGMTLGDGTFIVDPPTVLTGPTGIPPPDPTPVIAVVSTVGFADPAVTGSNVRITIFSEILECTGITPATFTTCSRGVGTIPPTVISHPTDSGVYPVTTLNGATGAGCGAGLTINVNPYARRDLVAGFLPTGVIRVDNELMLYTGVTVGAGDVITQFTGVTRCYRGTGGPNHPNNRPVYQHVITSTATVPTGIIGNAQRIMRVTVGP